MPIRAEFRHFYRGPQWAATRARILERAKNRCERCRKPNGRICFVYNGRRDAAGNAIQYWIEQGRAFWRGTDGRKHKEIKMRGLPARIRCVLVLAHLNHTPGDDRDENLRALCQWCHLDHDRGQHKETRSIRKDAGRPLLAHAEALAL